MPHHLNPGGDLMDTATHATGIRLFLARERLIEAWMLRVLGDAQIPSARRLEPFQLRDYVPAFIDVATATLRAHAYDGRVRTRAAKFARVHALERISEEFTLDEVRREFDHLEDVVAEYVCDDAEADRLLWDALAEAREITEAAFAGQSGTCWKEPTTATLAKPTVAAAKSTPNDLTAVRRTAS